MTPGERSRLDLLVVDDDLSVCKACAEIGRKIGFEVFEAHDVASAQEIVRRERIDILLLDLKLPQTPGGSGVNGGLTLLETVKTIDPRVAVIVMTAYATVPSAVQAMRMGAEDYLTKPFAFEELVRVLERTAERLQVDTDSRQTREKIRSQRGAGPLIGRSPEMEKLYRIVAKVTHSSHPVLILGESGTGKELVARTIHYNGPQATKPFVPVDCASIAPGLLEAEFFGYAEGALPAEARGGHPGPKDGLLASTDGGTIYLDEIAELPMDLQARLLRALQEKSFLPLGASEPVPLSGRILAASSRNLTALVEQGKFRRDLFFRLNVVNLRIPPLRERKDDIGLLADFFIERIERDTGRKHRPSDEAMRMLMLYDWPGNVQELESVLERACAMASGPVLHVLDLPSQLQSLRRPPAEEPANGGAPAGPPASTIISIAEIEKQAILNTIRQLQGDKLKAAKLLGIGKTTLYRKLKEYGLPED